RKTDDISNYEGSWVQLVGTYDGSENSTGINIYINALVADTTDVNTLPYAGMSDTTANVTIGCRDDGGSQFFDGQIAEIKVYSDELTPAEVLADYNSVHKATNLVAWWKIDEMVGNPADSSGDGHNSVLNLAEWVRSYNVLATGVTSGEFSFTTKGNPAFLGRGIDIGDDTNLPPITDDLQLNMPLWSTYLTGSPFDSVDANAHPCTVAGATWTSSGRDFDGAADSITI
ncbi:unnamed protein product, partial [marine sediment metagenome]